MRKTFAIIAAALAALALAACGETTTKSTPDESAKSPGQIAQERGETGAKDAVDKSTKDTDGDGVLDLYDEDPNDASVPGDDSGSDTATAPAPEAARIGDSITLHGADDGEELKVKLVRLIDPVPAGEFDQPRPGRRYVGVELVLTNTGSSTYADSPSNGANVISKGDRQFDSTILSEGPCGGSFGSSVKIAPGAKRRGCIPFEVTRGVKLKTLQFALDSGFADEVGEWRLR